MLQSKKVNQAIINLIKCEEEKWILQRDKLLQFHIELIKNNDLNNPTKSTLQLIETIKQWRTENLNTDENMDDDRYLNEVAMRMSNIKVNIMTNVLRNRMFNT